MKTFFEVKIKQIIISFFFDWADGWIGHYWDRKKKILYIGFYMFIFSFRKEEKIATGGFVTSNQLYPIQEIEHFEQLYMSIDGVDKHGDYLVSIGGYTVSKKGVEKDANQ